MNQTSCPHRLRPRLIRLAGLGLLLISLTACTPDMVPEWFSDLQGLISPLPTPVPTSPTPKPLPTASPLPGTPPTTTPVSREVNLTLWVPDILDPYGATNGVEAFGAQVEAFDRASREINVEVLVKKGTGSGGLYDLLSTASYVAPAIVPDLLILHQQELLKAAREGLIQPMDDYMPSDAGYFPTALEAMATEEGLWAFPYVATAEQMGYRASVTATAPITWTAVLSQAYSLVLPGSPPDGLASDALLSMYIGAGGRVVDDKGQPTLDRTVLEEIYGFILSLQEEGLFDAEQVLGLTDTEDCWAALLAGQAQLAPVSVSAYWNPRLASLSEEDESSAPEMPATASDVVLPTWVPTESGAPVTILHTWGIAVTTDDPVRKEAALELVRWLVSAQRMADLTRTASLAPTRQQVVETWELPADEEAFVLTLLSSSVSPPPASAEPVVRRALQTGLTAILQGESVTADASASQALANLRR
ncbi:MAG: extracellular solute-binding protein [Anaerolineae bacterium]|nr:extracellular solute-binding protein [Anaerolineae bacterium]